MHRLSAQLPGEHEGKVADTRPQGSLLRAPGTRRESSRPFASQAARGRCLLHGPGCQSRKVSREPHRSSWFQGSTKLPRAVERVPGKRQTRPAAQGVSPVEQGTHDPTPQIHSTSGFLSPSDSPQPGPQALSQILRISTGRPVPLGMPQETDPSDGQRCCPQPLMPLRRQLSSGTSLGPPLPPSQLKAELSCCSHLDPIHMSSVSVVLI